MDKEHKICMYDSHSFSQLGHLYADRANTAENKLYYKYDGLAINFDSDCTLKEVCGITKLN